MSYVTNISTFAPRKLNQLSRMIINKQQINTKDYMVQSAVVRKQSKKTKMKTIKDFLSEASVPTFVKYNNRKKSTFLCNIQQIKKEYKGVYFVMYFDNAVATYCINKTDYTKFYSYSLSQHANNRNENQILVTKNTMSELDHYLVQKFSYDELV